jgi:hypothetical protein
VSNIDRALPSCVSPKKLKELPRREKLRIEIVEPKFIMSNTESALPNRKVPKMLRLDPNLMKERMDTEDPRVM